MLAFCTLMSSSLAWRSMPSAAREAAAPGRDEGLRFAPRAALAADDDRAQ